MAYIELEKQIMRKIIQPYAVTQKTNMNLGTLLAESVLQDRAVILDQTQNQVELIYRASDQHAVYEIFTAIALIEQLLERRLIYTHVGPSLLGPQSQILSLQGGPASLFDGSGNCIADVPLMRVPISANLLHKLDSLLSQFYHPTAQLRELVDSDFLTYEAQQSREARAQTQQARRAAMIAWATLLVALITGALGLLLDVSISPQQVRKLTKAIESIGEELRSERQPAPCAPAEVSAKMEYESISNRDPASTTILPPAELR